MRDQKKRRDGEKRKKKKSPLDSMLMVIIVLIAAVCIAIVGVFIGKGIALVAEKDKPNKQYAQIDPTPEPDTVVEPEKKEELPQKRVLSNEYVNILVAGVDNGELGKGGELDSREADSILLLNYYYKEKVLNIISVPRDTVIAKNDKTYNLSKALKNGGIKELVKDTEDVLKTKINNYIIADINLFEEIVNITGGIGMVIPFDMDYDDNMQDLHIKFKKGDFVNLQGKEASNFIRWRKNNDGTSLPKNDISRMEHLREFFMKIIEKVKTSGFSKWGMLGEAIGKNVNTDMGIIQIVRYVMDIDNITQDNITYSSLNGKFVKGLDGDSFTFEGKNNREVLRLLNGSGIKNLTREDIKIKVYYDSSFNRIEGLKEELGALGYSNIEYQQDEVTENFIQIDKGLTEQSDFILNDFDVEKFEILSQNPENFDIILKVR